MAVVDDRKIETDEVHHSTFVKSDGSTWVAVWVDEDSHVGETGSQQVTVDFTGSKTVTVHAPMQSTSPGQVLTGERVTVEVADQPLLLQVTPAA